uniref:Uncharacterized protein n=1 Tax=Rousettus aegyptiacus TaxID=9407 RepID=A0A7J8BTH6_ROUAE|nr:hypothetical protein HJG63_009631 [Rousettus aegyptiacus]
MDEASAHTLPVCAGKRGTGKAFPGRRASQTPSSKSPGAQSKSWSDSGETRPSGHPKGPRALQLPIIRWAGLRPSACSAPAPTPVPTHGETLQARAVPHSRDNSVPLGHWAMSGCRNCGVEAREAVPHPAGPNMAPTEDDRAPNAAKCRC